MKKSILIIGGGGFFGKSIIDYFLKKKNLKNKINKIIIITKSSKNFIHPELKKNYKIIQIKNDIANFKKIPFADYVIYCVRSRSFKEDCRGVKNYSKLAKKYHVNSNIVYTSSGAVYGKQSKKISRIKENVPVDSSQKLSKTKKSYAIQKIKNEEVFQKLSNFGPNVVIARCFAFVGKNLPLESNYVVGNFISSILNKTEIIVKSNVKVVRSYMHSDDLAESLIKLALYNDTKFSIYNIGSENIIDIHALAKKLSKKYKIKNITQRNISKKYYDRYVPSISKFRKKFKFKKQLNSYSAIIKTIKEFKLNK